jgi:hypothetical protein
VANGARTSLVPSPSPATGDPAARLFFAGADEDLTAYLDDLRRRGPLVRSRSGWVTAHHAVCAAVLADPTFVPDHGVVRPPHPGISANGVEQPRWHAIVAAVLTADRVRTFRVDLGGWTEGLLETLDDAGRVDLVDGYAAPIAGMVVGELLGVPSQDWPQVQEWVEDLLPAEGSGHRRDSVRARHAVRRYLHELLLHHREVRGDAVLDDLLTDGPHGDALTQHEAGAAAVVLLLAGYAMIHAQVSGALHTLLRHPDQVEVLLARGGSWGAAVEEIMRWDPVVPVTTRRARADSVVAGVDVEAGSRLVLSITGANRDPAVFPEPATLDVNRADPERHLGLGGGAHECLGGGLGRLATEVSAVTLFERYPNARLAAAPRRQVRGGVRDVSSLPTRLGRPAR